MTKDWREDIQKQNYKDFKDNATHRGAWERDAQRFDDFRYGSHFSRSEEQELLLFRQAPLPISVTTAICDTAEAMMIASKPTVKVAPIIHPYDDAKTNLSKKVSQIYNYLIQKSWYDSLGALQFDRVVRDYTNVGHGLFYIAPRNEYGEFNVDIKHLGWRYFYPHPLTKSPFYDDSDNMIVSMELSKAAAYKFVRSIETDITEEQFENDFVKDAPRPLRTLAQRYQTSFLRDNSVLFMQRLQLEDQMVYVVTPLKSDINYKSAEVGYKIYTELTPELKKLQSDKRISVSQQRRQVLTEYTSVGKLGYKVIYPINRYNIVPLVYDHRDSPYPLGRVWYLYPLQRALNKFVMVAILNGSLMNSMRILYEKGSVPDVDEWKHKFATPGAMLSWEQVVPGYTKAPAILESKPLSDAWLQFPKYLSYIMEYISGIFGVMMGDSRETPDVFSTVASLQSAGGQKMKRRLAQSDATLSLVGQVTAEFYREYAPPNGFATVIDDNGEMQKPQTYNVLKPIESLKDKLNPFNSKPKVEIDPETDLSIGFKEVRFTTQSSNGFESGTEAALLTNLATQLKVPQLLPLILKRINIPDVDKIIGQLDTVSQQNATIEQMAQQIKDLDSKTKILANQVMQAGMKTEVAKFAAKMKLGMPLEEGSVPIETQQSGE